MMDIDEKTRKLYIILPQSIKPSKRCLLKKINFDAIIFGTFNVMVIQSITWNFKVKTGYVKVKINRQKLEIMSFFMNFQGSNNSTESKDIHDLHSNLTCQSFTIIHPSLEVDKLWRPWNLKDLVLNLVVWWLHGKTKAQIESQF